MARFTGRREDGDGSPKTAAETVDKKKKTLYLQFLSASAPAPGFTYASAMILVLTVH